MNDDFDNSHDDAEMFERLQLEMDHDMRTQAELEQIELADERGGAYGDPRRCPRHPNEVTSSADGMFDAPCGACEFEGEEAAEAARYTPPSNATVADARERILNARMGSFVNATDDYLLALKRELHLFVDLVDAELAERVALANRRREEDLNEDIPF